MNKLRTQWRLSINELGKKIKIKSSTVYSGGTLIHCTRYKDAGADITSYNVPIYMYTYVFIECRLTQNGTDRGTMPPCNQALFMPDAAACDPEGGKIAPHNYTLKISYTEYLWYNIITIYTKWSEICAWYGFV